MILYLITNTKTGMRYIGITSRTLGRRMCEHRKAATQGKGWSLHIAMRRDGFDAFTIETLETADGWDALCRRECELIIELGTRSPHGYNLTDGGEGGFGRPVSTKTRALLSAAHTGKRLSPEHRAKLSAAKMGRKLPPRSQQHSERISEGQRRAWARRKAK